MNVYDFDCTIFYPDSSVCFILYCLAHYPRSVLPGVPMSLVCGLRYGLKRVDTRRLKEQLFSFLSRLPDVEQIVDDFWEKNRHRLQKWYLEQKRDGDLIISASPEFLLSPIAKELRASLIATPMDRYTGRIYGKNCHGVEKVRRFRLAFPDATVESFYSDSLSDAPMAELAHKAFLIDREEIRPWPKT